jgi:hypothetical protein
VQWETIFAGIQALTSLALFFGLDARVLSKIFRGYQGSTGPLTGRQIIILCLCLGSLAMSSYSLYRDKHQPLHFAEECFKYYGMGPPGSGPMPWNRQTIYEQVDGRCFTEQESKYNLLGAAFHSFGVVDRVDETLTGLGRPHEISSSDIVLTIVLSESFLDVVTKGGRGTNYVILLLPKNLSTDQFSTIRQAKSLGAIVVFTRGGAP